MAITDNSTKNIYEREIPPNWSNFNPDPDVSDGEAGRYPGADGTRLAGI